MVYQHFVCVEFLELNRLVVTLHPFSPISSQITLMYLSSWLLDTGLVKKLGARLRELFLAAGGIQDAESHNLVVQCA